MPGYQDLSDYLDQLEGRPPPPGSGVMADPFGGTPTGTSTPAPPDPQPSAPAPGLTPLVGPRGPRASVSQVGDMAQPAPFQSLASAAPSDAGGPPTPAAGNSGDDELKKAQDQDAKEKTLHSLGQGYTRMADLILGRANPTQMDAPSTSSAKDLLARRDAARQATADATMNAPVSPSVKMFYQAQGINVDGMTTREAIQLNDMMKAGMSAKEAGAKLAQEKDLSANKLASEEKLKNIEESGQNKRNAATIAKDLQVAQLNADSRLEKGSPAERQQLQVLQDAKDSVHAFQAALSSHADDDTLRQMHDDLTLKMRELLKRAPNRGPAVAAMMNQIPDPGRLVGGAKAFVGYQDPPKMLDQIDKSLDKELANRGAGGTGGSGPADPQAALKTRIGELKAQGLDKAAIKAQLAKEGLTGGR